MALGLWSILGIITEAVVVVDDKGSQPYSSNGQWPVIPSSSKSRLLP